MSVEYNSDFLNNDIILTPQRIQPSAMFALCDLNHVMHYNTYHKLCSR